MAHHETYHDAPTPYHVDGRQSGIPRCYLLRIYSACYHPLCHRRELAILPNSFPNDDNDINNRSHSCSIWKERRSITKAVQGRTEILMFLKIHQTSYVVVHPLLSPPYRLFYMIQDDCWLQFHLSWEPSVSRSCRCWLWDK